MEDESQRQEMNEAIRAQRERGAVPRSMLPPEQEPRLERPRPAPEPPAAPEPAQPRRRLLSRLLGR